MRPHIKVLHLCRYPEKCCTVCDRHRERVPSSRRVAVPGKAENRASRQIVGRFGVVIAPRLPRQAPPAALPSRTRPGGSRSGLGPEDASLLLGRIFGWP